MKSRVLIIATLLVGAVLPTLGEAQRTTPAVRRANDWYRQPRRSGGRGYGNYPQYGYSSTRVEGARRGMADVVRSRGEAAESVSRAGINYQESRSKYIDNQLKWSETYQKKQAIGRAERERRFGVERAKRDKWMASRKSTLPPRLGPTQLDPLTGKIYWPGVLLGNAYAEQRKLLEELFVLRAHTTAHPELAQNVHAAAREMQDILKSNIRSVLPTQYVAARSFLDSLAREGLLPTG